MIPYIFSSYWFSYKRWSNFRMNGDLRLIKAKPLKRLAYKYIILPFKYVMWREMIAKGWRDEIDLEINTYIDDNLDDMINERAREYAQDNYESIHEAMD